MELRPFLLDQWLAEHQFATPPIELDLAASTGPKWTLREVLDLLEPEERERAFDSPVYYAPPEGALELREAVAGMAGVAPDHVRITTGAAEALWLLFFDAAAPGGNVIVPQPGFPTFNEAPSAFGLELRHYHLRPEAGFGLDLDELRGLTDGNTRLILLNSPHNPTGSVISDAELRAVHDFALERGIQLVVDEVYHPIYHGREAPSAARLPGATVIGDFSKALCLSGLRLGWIVERDAARRARHLNVRGYLTVSSSAPLTEALGVAAVRHRDRILGRARRVATDNRKLLTAFFAEHDDLFGWVPPTGGMTAFPWLRSGEPSRPFCQEAAAAGVLIAPGDCFDEPPHFRLGFAASGDGFAEGLRRLAAVARTARAAA
jgi:aspartate/methionine/tyrosine aminotransferase